MNRVFSSRSQTTGLGEQKTREEQQKTGRQWQEEMEEIKFEIFCRLFFPSNTTEKEQ